LFKDPLAIRSQGKRRKRQEQAGGKGSDVHKQLELNGN
jgi:hypothetical protein